MRKWEGVGSFLYYGLGSLYYFHQWYLIAGPVVIGSGYVAWLFSSSLVAGIVVAAFGIAILIFGIVAWATQFRKRHACKNPLLIITDETVTYEVQPDDNYRFEQWLSARARVSGANSYLSALNWSGDGQFQLTVTPAGFGISHDPRPEGAIYDSVRVTFPRPLQAGEVVSFTLHLTMHDATHRARPFLSKTVNDIYEQFVMRVLLPSNPASCRKEIFLSTGSIVPIYRDRADRYDRREIEWKVKRPQLGRKFTVNWTP